MSWKILANAGKYVFANLGILSVMGENWEVEAESYPGTNGVASGLWQGFGTEIMLDVEHGCCGEVQNCVVLKRGNDL